MGIPNASPALCLSMALGACFAGPGALQGQADSLATDTFADAASRDLVLTARRSLSEGGRGLTSYEARMTERVRVGVSVGPGLSRRGRTLYHRERVAQVWWSQDETGVLKWIGERSEQPALGEDDKGLFGLDIDVEDELSLDDIRAPIPFDPYGDRMDLLDANFIQPVSREGLTVYRFSAGDTLRLSLPDGNTIVLAEVLVQPRFEAWETVAGSLWFDADSGRLVRATFRPSGIWDHDVQEPGDLDDVPGILKPAVGRVDFIVLEYGLYEQRYWLPRKMSAEGVFAWGRGLVRMPLHVEWTVGEYLVDEAPTAATLPAENDVRRGRIGNDQRRLAVYSRPPELLATAPELPEPLAPGEVGPFSDEELNPLLERLNEATLGGRSSQIRPRSPAWGWRLGSSLRYDRVRGPSLGGERSIQLTQSTAADVALRVGAADPQPAMEVRLRGSNNADRRPNPGSPIIGLGRLVARQPQGEPRSAPGLWVGGYNRFAEANDDWGSIAGAGNSLLTLLAGHDDGEYFRATGAELGVSTGGPNAGLSAALFGERHRGASRETHFSLATLGDDQLRPNLEAEPGDVFGLRVAAGAQGGSDPVRGVVVVDGTAEVAGGDFNYARGVLTATGMRSVGGWPVALRLSAGTSSLNTPVQRQFLVGGTTTVRGFQGGALRGGSFAAVRSEVGSEVALVRITGFADVAWVGPAVALPDSRPLASGGMGASLIDGLFRLDVARAISGGSGWRLHLYLDGVL